MNDSILARPDSLKIAGYEIPLPRGVEYKVGPYHGTRGPKEFYMEYANQVAVEEGLSFDPKCTSADGINYFFLEKDQFPTEKTPTISAEIVEAAIPKYTKFLRIIPLPEISSEYARFSTFILMSATSIPSLLTSWVNTILNPLEKKINAQHFEGLRAFISKRPSSADRVNEGPIPTGVELALLDNYQINIEY